MLTMFAVAGPVPDAAESGALRHEPAGGRRRRALAGKAAPAAQPRRTPAPRAGAALMHPPGVAGQHGGSQQPSGTGMSPAGGYVTLESGVCPEVRAELVREPRLPRVRTRSECWAACATQAAPNHH